MRTEKTMGTRRTRTILAAAVLVFAARVASADHCPEARTTNAPPETSLAGVDFGRDKLPDVVARLGKPTNHKEGRDDSDPAGSGWSEYEWKQRKVTVSVSTEFYTADTGGRVEAVEVIQLSGAASRVDLGTGRGLRLGDDLNRVVAVYGATYVEGTVNGPQLGKQTMTYCFSDDTELSVGLDPNHRVVAIRLQAPVE